MEAGAFLVDKQAGITSADVIRKIKRSHNFKVKLGHAGTLDPMATGLLVVLVGKATRLQEVLQSLPKKYQGEIRLGLITTSDDVTGEVLSEKPVEISNPEETVSKLEKKFSGKILQRPPSYSAIKVDGKRSYELARSGSLVKLSEREVHVHDIELSLDGHGIKYSIRCGSGTYIRSIARDIGESVGCGACLSSIRRLEDGGYTVNEAISSVDLEDGLLSVFRPLNDLLSPFPSVELDYQDCLDLKQGRQAVLSQIEISGRFVSIKNPDGEVCAFAESSQNGLALRVVF